MTCEIDLSKSKVESIHNHYFVTLFIPCSYIVSEDCTDKTRFAKLGQCCFCKNYSVFKTSVS